MTAALLAGGAHQALALPACAGTVTTALTQSCELSGGANLTLTGSGSIAGDTASVNPGSGTVAVTVGESQTAGTISNDGTISGTAFGIDINPPGTTAGTTVTGGIANSGSIEGTNGSGAGIGLHQAAVLNGISNSGTVSSGNTAIGIWAGSSVSGGLINSGTLSGATFGFALYPGSISGGVTNTGLIRGVSADASGSHAAILMGDASSISGGIHNSGTISGAVGIRLEGASPTISGGIANSGMIQGTGGDGIRLDSAGSSINSITNTGTIEGATHAIRALNGATLGSLLIAGNNTAKFTGAVVAPATPTTVISGATYTMDNGQQFTVSSFDNAGTLKIGAGHAGTVTGNFSNTGTFSPAVDALNSFGTLRVSGTLSLSGTLLANDVHASGLVAGTLPGVIHHDGARTGTFDTVLGANRLFAWTAIYRANDVDLSITPGTAGFQDASSLAGATASAGASALLDQLNVQSNASHPVVLQFVNVPQAQLASAVSQTLPLLTGGSQVASGAALAGMNRVVQARMASNRGLSSGDFFHSDQHLWLKPFGSWANQDDTGGVSGYQAQTGGLALGVDGLVSDAMRMGATFAYAQAQVTGNSALAPHSATVDVYQLLVYGSYSLDATTEINFQAGLGQNQNHGQRRLPTWGSTAKAAYTSLVATAGAGLGRVYTLGEKTQFTPSVRADYTRISDDGYTEAGAGLLNLAVSCRSSEELILAVEGKLSHTLDNGLTVSANLGLGNDALQQRSSITASYAGAPGASFVTYGLEPNPWLARAGLAVTSRPHGGVEILARYDVEYRQGFLNQAASVKVRWAF